MSDAPERIWIERLGGPMAGEILVVTNDPVAGDIEYIRKDCVDGSKLGIMERNFANGRGEGILSATKHIRAAYEKYKELNESLIPFRDNEPKRELLLIEALWQAILADLENANNQ